MERFTVKNGRRLRLGYTTGSCAAAAAKGAADLLFSGKRSESVSIDTPAGVKLELDILDMELSGIYAECSVIKDAGDDPDITDGIKITARAELIADDIVDVCGGTGIGVVTRKGLSVAAGNAAINPEPMKMIISEVNSVRPSGRGVRITISAPEGVEIAKKTFNPRLGIEGGISILGTTGIVEPMSNDAAKESISLEISMMKENGYDSAVFVPGRYGKVFATESCGISENRIISIGNYAGYMLEQAKYFGMKNILLVGHTGKLIKIAGGNFDMHSRVSDAKFEIIAANYILLGGEPETAVNIMNCKTTEEALEYIDIDDFYPHICRRIRERCIEHVHEAMNIEVVIFSMERGLLAQTSGAENLIVEMRIDR